MRRPSIRQSGMRSPVTPRKRILVTAGNTREMIDPVRYLSNVSTGMMGYEVAREARHAGHPTVFISGPTPLARPRGVKCVSVVSSTDLQRAVRKYFRWCDVLFMTSAVCDFRPAQRANRKIKRKPNLNLKLVRTPDILKGLAKVKGNRTVVGFCLETENLMANAAKKLREKKLDYIVANFLGGGNKPFGRHKTSVWVLGRNGSVTTLRNVSKARVARFLIRLAVSGS